MAGSNAGHDPADYSRVIAAALSVAVVGVILGAAGGRFASTSSADRAVETVQRSGDDRDETAETDRADAQSRVDVLLATPPLVAEARLALSLPGPRPAPGSAPPRERLVINGVGDVNVDASYIPEFSTLGYEHALSGLGGLFLEDDLTVINLECPASLEGQRVPKQFNFQCDPVALDVLRADGVDVANQGNNHSLDYGVEGLLDSIVNIEAAGIASVGAGSNAEQAHRAALFEIKGWKVAVIGFGGVVPAPSWIAGADSAGMADGDTIETMTAAVRAAAEMADVVVVTIHWGKELQTGPPPDDVARAEAMTEAGADVIFGHHAHRLNSLELVNDRPVAWSLGNFVWPRLSAAGSDTAVAQVVVEPDGTIISCLLDVTIVSGGHPELDDPTKRSCLDL